MPKVKAQAPLNFEVNRSILPKVTKSIVLSGSCLGSELPFAKTSIIIQYFENNMFISRKSGISHLCSCIKFGPNSFN